MANLATFPRGNTQMIIFTLFVLSLPLWFTHVGGYEGLDTKIVIWAIFALGFDLLLGFTGYLSFGHAIFFGTSAYITGLTLLHVTSDVILGIVLSIVVSILIALVIGFLTLRRSGIYFGILTLAFAEMFHTAALSIFSGLTGGENGLTGLPIPTLFGVKMQGHYSYYLSAFFIIIGFYAARRIARSPFGLMLKAIKSNQTRLEYTGINVQRYKLSAFVLSSIYASVAGSLMVISEPYVASEFLEWKTSGTLVIMSVMGGVGTLFGPMFGAAFMLYFENVVSAYLEEQWLLVLGILFMLIVTFLPGGFVEGYTRLKDKFIKSQEDGNNPEVSPNPSSEGVR